MSKHTSYLKTARDKKKNWSKDDLCPICNIYFMKCKHSISEVQQCLEENYLRALILDTIKEREMK